MGITKVKICGITNLDDALAAIECGADALGFVFAPSPRQVTVEIVQEIVNKLPPFICKVGVFANSDMEQIRKTTSLCNLDTAQLHGDEPTEYCSALFPKVIKAFHVNNLPCGADIMRYHAAAYMLDKDKGTTASDENLNRIWQLAAGLRKYGPVILAGGLTPRNVRQAIDAAQPYAVDVSSGIEAEPGKKDYNKLLAFIKAAKQKPGGTVDIT